MMPSTIKLSNLLIGCSLAGLLLYSCSKSHDAAPNQTLPVVSIQDASQTRFAVDTVLRFYLYASKVATQPLSVDYTLVDGTAVSGKDYVMSSGTATIPAGELQGTFDVRIKGDPTSLRQPNLQFSASLTTPVSCTLGTSSAKGTIITENGKWLHTDTTGYTTPITYPGKSLVWSDEFSGSTLDVTSWNQEIGNGSGGWGNNELEYYTNTTKNTFLSEGHLIIEARTESINGFQYSSARLTTQNKKTFQYGRIDIRAKLPVSKGMWPAIWMLGSNISSVGWPQCGETDIMELVGTYPARVRSTIHWKNLAGGDGNKGNDYNLSAGNFSQQFHVFSVDWSQDSMKFYVDDVLILTTAATDVGGATYPFNASQFFIFNVAVGGNWPGPPDASTIFPQRMFVDYVRVFQ